MRAPLAPAAVVSLGVYLSACGGVPATPKTGASTMRIHGPRTADVTLPQPELSIDYDLDSDVYRGEPDQEKMPFPRMSDQRARSSISVLVKRYYAAVARGDGALACRLMYSAFAESIAEDYGRSAGTSAVSAGTCAAGASNVFKRFRRQFRAKSSTLRVIEIGVWHRAAVVQFDFEGSKRSYYMNLQRERGAWKVDMLLAGEQPVEVN
jgi:hypothetical protein